MIVLVIAMAFASVWGVVQLTALASVTRSVRIGTLLLAVGVGLYACGPAALAIQYPFVHLRSALTGTPLSSATSSASYTLDPFVEEVVKVLPILLLAWLLRSRFQRGLADHVLLGAALGAGFGLLEALMRFGGRAGGAIGSAQGWVLPVSISPPVIPGFGHALTSWLPAPVGSDAFLSLGAGPSTNLHTAWSAIAGLGVGLLVRERGRWRLVGPVLILLVGADHAAYNYDLFHLGDHPIGDLLAAPFVAAQSLLWLWPLVALGVATALDVRSLARAREGVRPLTISGEASGLTGAGVLVQYAVMGRPWTLLVIPRFVGLRRAAWFAADHSDLGLIDEVAVYRDRLDTAASPGAWQGVAHFRLTERPAGRPELVRRFWPFLLWWFVLIPALLYYVIGATPWFSSLQGGLAHRIPFVLLLVVPTVTGLLLLAWQTVGNVRALPAASRLLSGDPAVSLVLRILTAVGSFALGAVVLGAWARGTPPGGRLISGAHVLEALNTLLLVGGLALVALAFLWFPPTIALVALDLGATTILVPTSIAISGGLVTTAGLGVAGIWLSQAANQGGSGGSSGGGASGGRVPDIPQKPPAPKPNVRQWKLQRIVNDLWKGTESPRRIGDGTTMDAVRNELRTGRPTEGLFHSIKARESISALTRWLDRYGAGATREDRLAAERIRAALERALAGK